MNDLNRMTFLLEKKRKNDEVLSVEERYGKYKKKYCALKKEICDCFNELVPQFLFCGIRFVQGDDMDASHMGSEFAKIVKEEKDKGVLKKAITVLYEEYDFDKALCVLSNMRNRIVYEAYAPYWLSKCKEVSVPGFTHYNEIVDMYYEASTHMWKNNQGMALLFPPTKELMDAEKAQEMGMAS